MDFSLVQLRGFVAVADEQHFGRAAERLAMTQPPLTRQIQGLERALDVQLFVRGPRGVSLTAAGETFLQDARRILALADAAPANAQRVAAGESGTLRLGFTTIGAYALLGAALAQIRDHAPHVHIALTELQNEDQFDQLLDGSLDLGLVRPPVPAELASVRVHSEDLVLAVPSGHALATAPGPLALADLSEDYIGYSPEGSHYLHTVCAALVGVAGFLQTQIASQVPTMLALVRDGLGCALIPRSCTAMRVDGVTFRELADADRRFIPLDACWNPASTNPALARVLPHVTQLANQAVTGSPAR